MPPLQVETTEKKKPKPTSEPQAAVTKETASAPVAEGPVVFSANRTPTDYAKVGSSVSVITEKDIDAQSKTFLQDYLQQVPGVAISSTGGVGQTTSFMLRGFNQNYIKVLVDGMDVSDPSGTLYGGAALAGVVSIDTVYPTHPGYFQQGNAEYGAFNTWRGAYTAGYAAPNGSNVAFTVQGLSTDGISAVAVGTEDDAYRNGTISGRGEYRLSDAVTVFFAGRNMKSHTEYDDGFTPKDTFDTVDYEQHVGRVGTNVSLFGGAFVNTFAIQGMQLQRDYATSFGPSWFDGDRIKGEYRGVFSFNKQLALVAGVDWEREGATTSSVARTTVEVTSPYAEMIVEPIKGLVLTGGGRIDDHSAFGAHDTHRFTAAYLLPGTETKFHSSYGTGFRAPSLNELFGPFGGNPNLQPETSKSWDVGIEQGFLNNRLGFGATYFSIDMTNRIDFVFAAGPCPPCGFYDQVPGLTESDGVELTAFAKITARTILNAGYTYTNAEHPDGSRVARVPRHSLVLGVTTRPTDKLSLNVTGQYVADTVDDSPGVNVPVDDYFLLSAKVGYEILPGTVAYVRGENLLDQHYTTIVNYANPGLAVYGGVQFALPAN